MSNLTCPKCGGILLLREVQTGTCEACGLTLPEAVLRKAAEEPNLILQPRDLDSLPCPVCGRTSSSIKCYLMGTVLCLLVAYSASFWRESGCPRCIRKKILQFSLLNLITANLVWPFIILPMTLFHLGRSFAKGHSSFIRKHMPES